MTDRARYLADRAKDIFLARTHGIDEAMAVNKLDALIFPGSSGAGISAKAGHPTVIVPFGFVPNAPPRRRSRPASTPRTSPSA